MALPSASPGTSPPPAGQPPRRLARLLAAAGSMPAGLSLMALWGLYSLAGSLLAPDAATVLGTPAGAIPPLLLALSTGWCTLRRWPALLDRTRRRRSLGPVQVLWHWSVFLFHLSVLVLAAGGVWAALNFKSTSLVLQTGQEQVLPDGTVLRLLAPGSTAATPAGPGTPTTGSPGMAALVELRLPGGSGQTGRLGPAAKPGTAEPLSPATLVQEVRPNHPAAWGDSRLVLTGLRLDCQLEFSTPGQAPVAVVLAPGELASLDPAGRRGIRLDQVLDPRQVRLEIMDSPTPPAALTLAIGDTLQIQALDLDVRLLATSQTAGFIWRHTPGLGLVWAGLALAGLGSLGLLAFMPRRNRAGRVPDGMSKEAPNHADQS